MIFKQMTTVMVLIGGLTSALSVSVTQAQLAVGDDEPLVKARLLSDAATVEPGGTFLVGVHYTIKPKWHVYWHNPGDAGIPTEIKWQLPDGWQVGAVRWPMPIRFNQPGDVIGYGYENELLLVAEVTVPADAKVGQEVAIAATSMWLVCKETCIPGDASLNLRLKVGSPTKSTDAEMFATWAKRLPRLDGLPKGVTVSDQHGQLGGALGFTVKFDQAVTAVQAMPHEVAGVSVRGAEIELAESGREATVKFATRNFSQVDDTAGKSLPIVLTWQDDQGERHGGVYVFKP